MFDAQTVELIITLFILFDYPPPKISDLLSCFFCLLFSLAVIFNIYSTDGAFVYKDNMESLILACDGGNIPQPVVECFSEVILVSLAAFMHEM